MSALSAWFWNERFWLPHNVTWADLADPAPGVEYPKAGHLFIALPLALVIFAVRIVYERFIASTCAQSLHIQTGVGRRAQPNAVLEKVFTSITKNPDSRHLDGLSKQLDWEVRKVQRWFRHRRNQDKPSTHTKFCESMWRFTFYLCIFIYGFQFLWQTPWMWDTRHCWYGYPYQVMTPGLYCYYVTELAFYWSLMFSQFTDIKRKAAKLANYAKYQRLCDFLFIVFGVVFFITRLVIYPVWVLNSSMFESWAIVGPFPSWWLFNILLLVLQVLHIIWSYLIARIAVKAMLRGKVCNDVRSDIESSSEEEPDMPTEGLKTSHSPKGENGTNGHCAAAKARAQNHSSW
ncbi:ceramide synthase 5 isoform X2 [Mastacembelus armatus]|uniref:ceramide synthase 5 isoform X2 n=1 Tax=Mastacembelus armatus TaxID=205130 RepID=UPI000E45F371|nr:ceramide synthase 5 isoform X2 [Mastacembelus armatus]